MTLTSGTQLGSYVILSPLGSGGMGEVYKARDPRLNRLVAIKVLAPTMLGEASALARFEREARILAGLNHPNIVAIHDVGAVDGTPFVVTELLDGTTLSALLAQGPMPQARALAITLQIAKGLVAAHAKGVVHRDLKPSNIMVSKGDHAKLLDFGLAKELRLDFESNATDAMAIPGHTLKGTLLGTVGYMAPEQVRGEGSDARSDLFALGVLLLEMVTGAQAFKGDSAVDVLHAILREDPLAGRDFPAQLRPILERLLAKDPTERFQTAKDLVFMLAGVSSPSLTQMNEKASSSHPLPRWMTVAITASLMVGIGGLSWGLVHRAAPLPTPTWTQVSTRPTSIVSARFSPDGRSLAYSAAGSDGRMAIFSLSGGEAFPQFTEQKGKVLALDQGGEIYFSCQGQIANNPGAGIPSDLFRWKGAGTSPRVWLENIQDCDLGPDDQHLALIRYSNSGLTSGAPINATLESPPGTILARSNLWMACPRWSPDGKSIAYLQHTGNAWEGQIIVVDLAGRIRMKSRMMGSVQSLAWAPDGQEIVFSTDRGGNQPFIIAAMDLHGRTRDLLATGQSLTLMDIDPRGRMLISATTSNYRSWLERNGKYVELDFPFQHDSGAMLSTDGSKVAVIATETDQASWIYIRDHVTNNLMRLTPGDVALAFSTNSEWLLVRRSQAGKDQKFSVALVPIGSGSEVLLNVAGLIGCWQGSLPDPDHPFVQAISLDGTLGWFLLDPKEPPRRIAKDVEFHAFSNMVATNSGSLWGYDFKRGLVHGSMSEKPWTPVGGPLADRVPMGWDPGTGEILVVQRQQLLDPATQNQPLGRLNVERMNPTSLQLKPDRVLDFHSLNARFNTRSIGSKSSSASWREQHGYLYIVDGMLAPAKR